jgi:hypothetical protein
MPHGKCPKRVDRACHGNDPPNRRPSTHEGRETIRSTEVPDLDIGAVSAMYERRVRARRPDLRPKATRLLERLPPERWMLEWHLPWWLGHAFGLSPDIARELVLSNVCGLGSVRLQDDLADADVPPGDIEAATELSTTLYELALEPYRARFAPRSPLWAHLETTMGAWRQASDASEALASRGAPLKISAFAVCLLADRADQYDVLDRLLDDALEALVLYDHLADWQADLEAGRWNAFVAGVSTGPQVPTERSGHRRAVLVALMTTDAVAVHIGRVEAGLLRAADLAETLDPPVPPLIAHVRGFARQAGEDGRALQAHYRDLGDRAAKLLLDPPDKGRR